MFNVLVATSVGEEGLDIGEVDLIVCYDAQKTPIRMVSLSDLCVPPNRMKHPTVATCRSDWPQARRLRTRVIG